MESRIRDIGVSRISLGAYALSRRDSEATRSRGVVRSWRYRARFTASINRLVGWLATAAKRGEFPRSNRETYVFYMCTRYERRDETRRAAFSPSEKQYETRPSLNLCSRDTWNSKPRGESNEAPGGSVPGNCDEIWWPLLIKIV